MKNLMVLIILIVMLPISSYGVSFRHFIGGNKLVAHAQEYDKYTNGIKFDEKMVGYYSGFIIGVYDATEWMYKKISRKTTLRQMCSIVSNYLKVNPDKWHLMGTTLVEAAFGGAFGYKENAMKLKFETLQMRSR